jgi:hypothetical protein
MVRGQNSVSINGGKSLSLASNLRMSLSGSGHSITPCIKDTPFDVSNSTSPLLLLFTTKTKQK